MTVWRCPSCVHDFTPDDGPYDYYQCFDCVAQCEKVEVCDNCGEDAEACDCDSEFCAGELGFGTSNLGSNTR